MKSLGSKATRLASETLSQDAFRNKKAHAHCRLFRNYCWLPEPQPECHDCLYLPLEDRLGGQK